MQYRTTIENGAILTEKVVYNFTKEEYVKVYKSVLLNISQDKSFKYQGFRPGKIPLNVLETVRFDEIRKRTIETLQQRAITDYTNVSKIIAVVDIKVEYNESNPDQFITFYFTFEKMPAIDISFLSEVEIKDPKIDLEDGVEEMVLALRTQRSTYVEVDQPAGMDSLVKYTSKCEDVLGETYAPLTNETPVEMVVGSYDYPNYISAAFVGKKAGDDFTIAIDEGEENYNCEVHLLSVSERKLPEVDDAFVSLFLQRPGDLEDLKAEIKKNVEREIKINRVRYILPQITDAIYNKLHNIDLPPTVIQNFQQGLIENQINLCKQQKLTDAEIKAYLDNTYIKESRIEAVKRFLNETVFELLGIKFNLQVTQEEIDAYLVELSVMFEYPQGYIEETKKNENEIRRLISDIFSKKIVETVLGIAKVVPEQMTYTKLVREVTAQPHTKAE